MGNTIGDARLGGLTCWMLGHNKQDDDHHCSPNTQYDLDDHFNHHCSPNDYNHHVGTNNDGGPPSKTRCVGVE
ncbi:MAG: hypothetical protein GY926_12160, partial [bacterium]|nr:hypothetical protein [bacterium]